MLLLLVLRKIYLNHSKRTWILDSNADQAEDQDIDADAELLEEIPLPGHPSEERKRREQWLKLPRRARVAIRRLHRNLKHIPTPALVSMLKAAKAPIEYINAAREFKCNVCAQLKNPPQTHKVSPPRPYEFNFEVGVDVFEITDAVGTYYDILNCVCMGSTFNQAYIVRAGERNGTPSSSSCLRAFVNGWVKWAGWPRQMTCDRGLHNRGIFSSTATKNGVRFRVAGLESPEQIGRVERRGDILKKMMTKIIKETNAVGAEQIEMILTECLNACNELCRHGGFSPSQWVLGKFPRNPGSIHDEQEFADIAVSYTHLTLPTICSV